MSFRALTKAALLVAFAVLLVPRGASAAGETEITQFETGISNHQAGAHPDLSTSFSFATESAEGPLGEAGAGCNTPDQRCEVVKGGIPKDIVVDIPKGVAGNPTAAQQCTNVQLTKDVCPIAAQVGVIRPTLSAFGGFSPAGLFPLYNMVPERGEIAKFGTRVFAVSAFISIGLRSDGSYGLRASSRNLPTSWGTQAAEVTVWGVPLDPVHDAERACPAGGNPPAYGCALKAPAVPYLVAPMDCGVDASATLKARSYQHPDDDDWVSATAAPEQVHGCEQLSFKPTMSLEPTNMAPSSATGLEVSLSFPQSFDSPNGLEAPPLRDATVTLPEGMAINPASAAGLQACTDAQLALASDAPVQCPLASSIGTAEASTPVLEERLTGKIYLRSQASGDPESGQMFRLGLVLENEERGLSVRLPGQVRVNPQSGRIVTEFRDNPQLPVETIDLHFKAGPRAPLMTPSSCGVKTTTARLTSWAGQVAELSDSFTIPCPLQPGFTPRFTAGTVNPLAGATSLFVLSVERNDGEQVIDSLTTQLPSGLTAYLKGVPYCPEGALAAAASRSGEEEVGGPSCPSASQVGRVTVGAGAGSPLYVDTGKAYLAGPYKGAPLSLAIVTPAVAGPFDLGTVVVRAALRVDPVTAEITAVSDSLPTIVKGVPLAIRSIDLSIDRPDFTLNPTGCVAKRIAAAVISTQGQTATPSSPFQVADCGELTFKPRLAMEMSGPTQRSGHPKLRATLTMPKGGANIRKAQVLLPKTEFLENAHIRTICTRVQYAAKACPKAAVYGYAKAWTPLLDEPLQGPVYLRSSSNELPDLVADLDGQIEIDLPGRIDSVNARIRNTFWAVPDAPVSKFVLTMQGGKKSLLANNTNLCKAKPRANLRFEGQNGKVFRANPLVGTDCKRSERKQGARR